MDTQATCANCRFWDGSVVNNQNENSGRCVVRPPVVPAHSRDGMGEWPFTEAEDFCGEHKDNAPSVTTDLAAAVAPFARIAAEYLRDQPDADEDDLIILDLLDEQGHPVTLSMAECRALVEAAG